MSLGSLQTVALILMFLTPGALFIYVCALNYSPSMRAKYLKEQFPLELTIYYLVVSTAIHSCLILVALGIIHWLDLLFRTDILESLIEIVTRQAMPGPGGLSLLIVLTVIYFFSSLALAYGGGRLFGKRLMRPVPLWQDLLVEMQAWAKLEKDTRAKVEKEPCIVELVLRGQRKLKGRLWQQDELSNPQCWGEETDAFQLIIEDGIYTTGEAPGLKEDRIWVHSREILEMRLSVSDYSAKFILANGDKEGSS